MSIRVGRLAAVATGAAALTVWSWGCGGSPDDTTRMNHVIGGMPPPPAAAIDTGILIDHATYQPTTFEPLEGFSGPPRAAAAAVEESPEAAELRAALDGAFAALIDLNIEGLLDVMPPQGVAALRSGPFVQHSRQLTDSVRRFFAAADAKVPGNGGSNQAAFELLPLVRRALIDSLDIDVQGDAAMVGVSLPRLKENAESMRSEIVSRLDRIFSEAGQQSDNPQLAMALSQVGLTEMPSGAEAFDQFIASIDFAISEGEQGEAMLPMRRIDGGWRLDVPIAFNAQHAGALSDSALSISQLLDELTASVEASSATSAQDLQLEIEMWMQQNQFRLLGATGPLLMAFADFSFDADMEDFALDEPEEPVEQPQEQPRGGGGRFAGRFAGGIDFDEDDSGGAAGGGTPASTGASFNGDVEPLLSARCSSCHQPTRSAVWQQVRLDLRGGGIYNEITSKSSEQDDSLALIVPGDPDASYLFQKVSSDSPFFGQRMPTQGGFLSPEEIEIIRRWIADGAHNN